MNCKTPNRRWRDLQRAARQLRRRADTNTPLLDAYLYMSRVRCGRPTCKCMRTDYRHSKWCLSFVEDGRSRTLTVPDAWLARIAKATDAYREARGHLRQFGGCVQALTDTVQKQTAVRVRTGRGMLGQMVTAKERKGANR